MSKPVLLVIGGCNGSGKSSFSHSLTGKNIPFDYDKNYLKIYNSLSDFDLRDKMAHNKTRNLLEKKIATAVINNSDFCYETNFNSTPLYWPNHFRKNNYQLDMIFFCLESIEEAKRRVNIRVENGGHYVPPAEIKKRFFEGYKNLDKYFKKFDNIHLLNSSPYNQPPQYILTISNGQIVNKELIPAFLTSYLPAITKLVRKSN